MSGTRIDAPQVTPGMLESMQGYQTTIDALKKNYGDLDDLTLQRMGLTRSDWSEEELARKKELEESIKARKEKINKFSSLLGMNPQYGDTDVQKGDKATKAPYNVPFSGTTTEAFLRSNAYRDKKGQRESQQNALNIMIAAGLEKKRLEKDKAALEAFNKRGARGVRSLSEEEYLSGLGDIEKNQYLAAKSQAERQALAAQGKLPVPEHVQKAWDDYENQAMEAITRKYGVDAMQTEGGKKAYSDLMVTKEQMMNNFRRGEEAAAQGLFANSQNMMNANNQQALSNYASYSNQPMGLLGAYQGQYQMGLPIYNMNYQTDLYNKQNRAGAYSGLLESASNIISSYLGGGRGNTSNVNRVPQGYQGGY